MKAISQYPKTFVISILVGLLLPLMAASSCEPQETTVSNTKVSPAEETTNSEIKIITIEGHEYILWENHNGANENVGGICHSESCPLTHYDQR